MIILIPVKSSLSRFFTRLAPLAVLSVRLLLHIDATYTNRLDRFLFSYD